MKPTMEDVAKVAGVGVATVDRVINKRAAVRPETAQKVLEAAEQIGFQRTGLIKNRIKEQSAGLHLGFILQKQTTQFYKDLGDAIQLQGKQSPFPIAKTSVIYLDDLSPQVIADELLTLGEKVDAIALVSTDHPLVNQAIQLLAEKGKPVISLLSDLTAESCAGFVGIDHRKIGRMAAWNIQQLCPQPGKIGLIVGSHRYLCQELSEMSFRSFFREHAPDFQILETLVSLEDIALAESATLELLKQHPDLTAIFVAGGGIEGVIKGLQSTALNKHIVTICLDLTRITQQALIDGVVDTILSHPMEWMVSKLLESMVQTCKLPDFKRVINVTLPALTFTTANV
ncbi:LacI family DNA-binding transcriptional regulator [Leeia sp. TBRC 13508]|uniref:LacI family DNA-binding transcriptional regulator n=1 Tax=Leeia speluncae TaxID=2884804 RepID=A0ABS8D8W4_9NEIS|nr:LacI family DNA-binding transcriptional regulator [Leeia speluncae]MCB6184562.1 LacI family DNA-binding transcriptional regulator [Leeia speluncae]